MGRSIKNGLSFFPLDVEFFSDVRIRRLISHFGADGPAFYLYVLCRAYKNGYYVVADDDFLDDAAIDIGCDVNRIRLILQYLLERSLLIGISPGEVNSDHQLHRDDADIPVAAINAAKNGQLGNSVKYLTSHGIQAQYQESKKNSKRDIEVDETLWVLKKNETLGFIKVCPNENNSGKNSINPGNIILNPGNIAKKKKNKLKENKKYISSQGDDIENQDKTKDKTDNSWKNSINPENIILNPGNNIINSNNTTNYNDKTGDDDGFDSLWDAYPRKSGDIRRTYMEYLTSLNSGATLDEMLKALEWQKEQSGWKENGGQYVPGLEKWLRNRSWKQQKPKEPERPRNPRAPVYERNQEDYSPGILEEFGPLPD